MFRRKETDCSGGKGASGCPGSKAPEREQSRLPGRPEPQTQLNQWPIQLMLVPTHASYFTGADLLIAADCVPFARSGFHDEFLRGRAMVMGCPKLDNPQVYVDKLAEIFSLHNLKAVEVLVMEVPCCSGMVQITKMARDKAGVKTPIRVTTIGVRGEHLGTREIATD